MAELKFSCSQCGQHISCDEQWAGRQIACPACSHNLVIPQLAPAAPAAAAVATVVAPRLAAPPPPPAPVAAVAAVAAPVPGPSVAARPKKREGAPAKKILVWSAGCVAFVVAMYFGLKVADKWQLGFNRSSAEAAKKSGGGEMGHIATVYAVLDATDADKRSDAAALAEQHRKERELREAKEAAPKADPTLAMPAAAAPWSLTPAADGIPQGRLMGSSGNAAFQPDTIQITRNATATVLSFQQGVGTTTNREVFIYLPVKAADDLAGRKWTVGKDASGKDTPRVVRRWTFNPKYAPVEKTFAKGYALQLELGQPGRDWQPCRIYLALPDTNQTLLAGQFSLAVPHETMMMGGGFEKFP